MTASATEAKDSIKGVIFLESQYPDGRIPGIVYIDGTAHAVLAEVARFQGGAYRGAQYLKFYPRPTA